MATEKLRAGELDFHDLLATSVRLWAWSPPLVQISPYALRQLGIEIPKGGPQKITLNVAGLGPVEVNAIARDLIYDGLLNAAFLKKLVLAGDLASMRAWATIKPAS